MIETLWSALGPAATLFVVGLSHGIRDYWIPHVKGDNHLGAIHHGMLQHLGCSFDGLGCLDPGNG